MTVSVVETEETYSHNSTDAQTLVPYQCLLHLDKFSDVRNLNTAEWVNNLQQIS